MFSVLLLILTPILVFVGCVDSEPPEVECPDPLPIIHEFPIISIQTNYADGDPTRFAGINRTDWLRGSISLSYNNPEFEFKDVPLDIRGRGNSSWNAFEGRKQPYRLRFLSGQNRTMLDSGYAARNWSILAKHNDKTLLRDYTAFMLGRELGNFSFVPFARFVHVYINDEYRGVYILTDHMDTDGDRVNINQSSDPALREYYIEQCQRGEGIGFRIQSHPTLATANRNMWFEFRDDSGINQEHIMYVRAFMQKVHDAIVSRDFDAISRVTDIDSMVDFYLVNEIFKDADIAWSSNHMTIRGTGENRRLHMGPLWDFDLSSGNAGGGGHVNLSPHGFLPEGRDLPTGAWMAHLHPWFYHLVHYTPEFRALVTARLYEIKTQHLPTIVEKVTSLTDLYQEEFSRNFERWEILGTNVWWNPPAIVALQTHEEHVQHFIDFLISRAHWLYYTYLV